MSLPPGWRLQRFESLASTSDLCAQLAEQGEPAGLAILAARQTAARGSRGRAWETLPGNLAVSVLLRPRGPAADAGQWALLAAVALADAIELTSPGADIALKWPNDLLLLGRKLGGILIDSALRPDGGLDWLVIGFGANLAAAPPGAACLPSPQPSPLDVANALLHRIEHWDRERALGGFAAIRAEWLRRGPALGTPMRIEAGPRPVAGTFGGLAESGALLLQSAGRVHAFPTGEILQGWG